MKRVTFNEQIFVHSLFVWAYAYKKARQSNYEQQILDRYRFKNRIKDAENILETVFDKKHRTKIFKERFDSS